MADGDLFIHVQVDVPDGPPVVVQGGTAGTLGTAATPGTINAPQTGSTT